ncbi:MBL fold metallo-hydrolase [Maricaulis sp.]|uniref:MBL fold metallo-hydrolase n=1 Tax=Maricaulis sp. TaxID=1486257 RepID=UPI0026213AFC|nr:MBL fold metallo-hydrolase [Maricaulis sp.]
MTGLVRITLLGTGSSGGVPRANGDWGLCNPLNPRNRRRRCSALIERAETRTALDGGKAVTRVVIDTSPDFREQMLSARVRRIDGVLFTHDHADQTHGIDDLRAFAYLQRQRIPVWMDEATRKTLLERFGYTFETPPGSSYPAILDQRAMPACGTPVTVDGPGGQVDIVPFEQEHGRIRSLGFRVGAVAYSPDINILPEASELHLHGIACWVVDALRREPHPTHFTVEEALAAIRRVGAKQGVLTNLHNTLDYDELVDTLPAHVWPGYDGMRLVWDGESVQFDDITG